MNRQISKLLNDKCAKIHLRSWSFFVWLFESNSLVNWSYLLCLVELTEPLLN